MKYIKHGTSSLDWQECFWHGYMCKLLVHKHFIYKMVNHEIYQDLTLSTTGCGTLSVTCLFLFLEILNVIHSIWEFIQFLYMILVVLSQNFIGMG